MIRPFTLEYAGHYLTPTFLFGSLKRGDPSSSAMELQSNGIFECATSHQTKMSFPLQLKPNADGLAAK